MKWQQLVVMVYVMALNMTTGRQLELNNSWDFRNMTMSLNLTKLTINGTIIMPFENNMNVTLEDIPG